MATAVAAGFMSMINEPCLNYLPAAPELEN